MHNLVSEEADEHRAEGDDENASESRYVIVDSVDELFADDGVDRRPADTCQDVEDGNELHSPPAKPESGRDHLSQAESWAKGREEADSHDTDQVEEETDEHGICDSQKPDGLSQDTDREGGNDHVGGEPLGSNVSNVAC